MSHANHLLNLVDVQDANHLCTHFLKLVGIHLFWLVRSAIAQEVWYNEAVAKFTKVRHLVPPAERTIREAVEEEDIRLVAHGFDVDIAVIHAGGQAYACGYGWKRN